MIDLDEIRPDRFVIHNDKVRSLLRGEGVTSGKFFELGTWRREGLIARIRERGFNVRTIADRIGALPQIGDVAPPGEIGFRALSQSNERVATFGRATLRWHDQPTETNSGKPIVRLPGNVAVRRRRGRGVASYFITAPLPNGQINLLPITETEALIHAYAQIAKSDPPATLHFSSMDDAYIVPDRQAVLPPAHAQTLDLISNQKPQRWTFPRPWAHMAEDVFGTLGILLQPA
jgi:hypothetical protein